MITSRIGGAVFQHNGDFSGDVVITTEDNAPGVAIPYATLQAFLAQKTVRELIEIIEQLDLEDEDDRDVLTQLARVVS